MIHLRHILFALAMGLISLLSSTAARGQSSTADEPVAPTAQPKPAAKIEYVGPDTFILLDAEGRPQPVLNMSYEEFVAAWKRMQQPGEHEETPRFTIEELQISGTPRGDQIELTADLTIHLVATGPIKVPLGMTDAILAEAPRIEMVNSAGADGKPGKSFVSYDQPTGGYVAWIDAPTEGRCKVSIKSFRPLVRNGNQASLALNLPRALVSRLTIEVPERVVEASASDGVVPELSAVTAGSTRLAVDGPRGNFQLRWTTAAAERPELADVLSATGAMAINIDGHSVRCDAVLTVRSYGGSFDRLRVRLPPGAQLIEDHADAAAIESSNYRLSVDGEAQNHAGGAVATVEFTEKQVGPVKIRLSTEQPLGFEGADSALELAGFEVIGAVRQFGDVAITVADDWQLRWENGPFVRQVERSELDESLRTIQPTVAFQYDRQPWSLRAEIAGRPMVVHVAPQYTLRIGTDQAELRARLSYQVPGARAFEFRVQLNGWELTSDPIESSGLVDRDRAVVSRDGVLVLPLGQASPRRATIEFSLRRPLAADATNMLLPLPAPEADTVATGELSVIADAAIELVPDMQASRGLSPLPVVRAEARQADDDGGEQFAFRSFVANSIFAARRAVRPREVETDIRTHLALGWNDVSASQEIGFEVRYQPIVEIVLELPRGWSVVDDRVRIIPENSAEGALSAAVSVEPETHGRPTQLARVTLAQPRLGKFHIQAEYQFDQVARIRGSDASFLKLPQPSATRTTAHRVDISAAADMSVSIDRAAEGPWRAASQPNVDSPLTLEGRGADAELPLVIGAQSAARAPTTRVERVWLQTWQAGSVIQDRAAVRFRTSDASAVVELPPNSTASDVEVLIDGVLAELTIQQEGRIAVALPDLPSRSGILQTHTLELRYRRPAPAGLITRLSLTPPQLVGGSGLCDVLWHVVLPGDRHIVSTPDTMSAVESAQWLEVVLGRTATKAQVELEKWVGAAAQPSPTASQNAYLYSGLAPVSINLITAPRWLIVLAASGAMLALASAWMYLPAVRRPWIAIALAGAIAGLAFAFPTQAVLAGQAAILGLALSAVALLLRRWSGEQTIVAPQPATTGSTHLRLRSSLRTDS
ncbi:MAG: hypothetical protein AB7U97_04170, partial [Pirellulales bacterium]